MDDSFQCSHCGAELSSGANFCRECGSSESDGWQEDELGNSDDDGFDYEEFVDREFGDSVANKETPAIWRFVAVVLLILFCFGFLLL
ncbi:MAG: zinc-ribbon domain-containing protein [Rubripirellula sp.]